MLERLFRYLGGSTETTHIIEVEPSSKLPEITGDLRESLKALSFNPAFGYILQRLRFQKAAMETAFREGMNLTEIQLRYLQAGIHWAGQIQKDIQVLTQAQPNKRATTDYEAEEFAKVKSNIDLIGA